MLFNACPSILSKVSVKTAGYDGGHSVDGTVEYIPERVREWKEHAWWPFGWQGSWRFKTESNRTCNLSPSALIQLWFIFCNSFLSLEHVIIHLQDTPLQNILVVSKYYSRITLKRLAELLCLSVQVYKILSLWYCHYRKVYLFAYSHTHCWEYVWWKVRDILTLRRVCDILYHFFLIPFFFWSHQFWGIFIRGWPV